MRTTQLENAKKAGPVLFFALLFFLSLLLPLSFSRILVNQPQAGQMLEVLVENETSPGNVTLIRPDGQSVVVPLDNGQMRYNASVTGRWVVQAGGEELAVVVTEPGSETGGPAGSGQSPLFAAALVLAALIMIGLIALAVDALIVRPPPRHAVVLEKSRQGDKVSVRLRAGGRPLRHVRVEDEVGPGWTGAPMRMSRQRLEAGQSLEMEYEWVGEMGEARAGFEVGRHAQGLEVRSGRAVLDEELFVCAPGGTQDTKETGASRKEEMPKKGRKLSRLGSAP